MTTTRTSARPRVLVVEDEAPIRDALERAYTGAGYDVRAHGDGTDFENAVDTFRPDLVVLDVMLPRRDGWTLAAALRSRSDAAS